MNKSKKEEVKVTAKYEITPLGMLNNAKVWYLLYRQNIYLGTNHQIVAVYCLLIGLEMLLKAYLIYLNKEKYSYDSEMITLGHKFENIIEAIQQEKETKLLSHIDKLVKTYNLLSVDTNNLRYPKKGDAFLMHIAYLKPYNKFDEIFDLLTSEISAGIINKFYED